MGSQRVGHDWTTELNWTDRGRREWKVGTFSNFVIGFLNISFSLPELSACLPSLIFYHNMLDLWKLRSTCRRHLINNKIYPAVIKFWHFLKMKRSSGWLCTGWWFIVTTINHAINSWFETSHSSLPIIINLQADILPLGFMT